MNLHLIGAAVVAGATMCCINARAQTGTEAKPSRPNIVVILADDVGFSDLGAFGGEIRTPNLDRLAEGGKKFTQFYNTARCCPSRASLMTGLYAHQAGVGHLIFDTGHPGYGNHLTSDTITIAEMLKESGYGTYMAGKWHLAPRSYDPKKDVEHWPTSRGFDKFYGTINGSGSFYDPSTLCRGTTYITPENDPEYKPEEYYYTDALSDNAIKFVSDHERQNDDQPFFLYLAYTAAHWPLQAPEDAIEEYRGKYDKGYAPVHGQRVERLKELGLIPEVGAVAEPVGDWDKVKNKEVEASLMETYAAMLTRMDQGIGRLVDTLQDSGELDNTLIVYLQDNGGCAEDGFGKPRPDRKPRAPMGPDEIQESAQPGFTREGLPVKMGYDVKAGPADTFVAYKENWANVSNAPFRLYKHYVHEGGISTPMIAHWPAGIKATSDTKVVRDPAHLIDLTATFLDLAEAKQPEMRNGVKVQPVEGVSLVPVLTGAGELNRDKPIFFEHESNRAVRDGKWKLVAVAKDGPWELYDMTVDRAEMNDLSKQHPDIVKKMSAQWDQWAARSRVLPLGGWEDRRGEPAASGAVESSVNKVVLKQGEELPVAKSPALAGKHINIEAEITEGPLEGVIVAQGASQDGYSLFAQDGHIRFQMNRKDGSERSKSAVAIALPAAVSFPVAVTVKTEPDGKLTLTVGSDSVAVDGVAPFANMPAQGIAAGVDTETPVADYPRGFPFKGKLGTVTVETAGQ